MKQTTKDYLLAFILCLILLVGSATGAYAGCTWACWNHCPAAQRATVGCGCEQCDCCGRCGRPKLAPAPAVPCRQPRDDPKKCCPDPMPPAQ